PPAGDAGRGTAGRQPAGRLPLARCHGPGGPPQGRLPLAPHPPPGHPRLLPPRPAVGSTRRGAGQAPRPDRPPRPGTRSRPAGPMMENPMLRSGLGLAGANTWLVAGRLPPEAEDGLLTAEDVTGLDLLATELVVLSACETGLGQVHVGEGVFGLRRAFVLAGAKTLGVRLWEIPHEPNRELMEEFYRRLLAGDARTEALRQAQLALRGKYPAPYYWGAFICQGDPSPLGTSGPGAMSPGIADYPFPG